MKIVRNAIYMSILGTSLCVASCGRNNNQSEGAADPVEESERDTIVSDTVGHMP